MSLVEHPRLNDLLALIGTAGEPEFIPINPPRWARPRDCFANSARFAAERGCRVEYGWLVGGKAGVLLEGQFHAIVRFPDESPLDVTPDGGKSEGLFIPDKARVYAGHRVPNLKVYLTQDPAALRDLAAADYFQRFLADVPEGMPIAVACERVARGLRIECGFHDSLAMSTARAFLVGEASAVRQARSISR